MHIKKSILFIQAVIALGMLWGNAVAGSYDELILASKMGDIPAMHALMKKGLDPDSTDKAGNSLLTIAASEGNEALVKVLLAYKPKLNSRNQNGETALQLASYRGYAGIVKELIAAGAPLDTSGWPALIYAIYSGHENIAETLINAGADKNATADNGMTALMFAAQNQKVATVRLLLAAGANPDLLTPRGDSAYSLSLKANNSEITKMIDEALEKHRIRSKLEAEAAQSSAAVEEPRQTEQ